MSCCPHCSKVVEPPPKRSRKCPHCGERIEVRGGQVMTSESAEKFDTERTKKEAAERFREGREIAVQNFQNAKDSGVVVGFKLLLSGDECGVCQKNGNRIFPIAACTVQMLPPYEN